MGYIKLTPMNSQVDGKVSVYDIKETGEHAREDGQGYVEVMDGNGNWSRKYKAVERYVVNENGDKTGSQVFGYVLTN